MAGFAAGQRVTAALLNTVLDPPRFAGYLASAQTLATGQSYLSIALDTELYDTANGHSTTSNNSRYVVQVAGLYNVTASVGFVPNSTGNRSLQIGVNGGAGPTGVRIAGPAMATNSWFNSVSALLELDVGDYVECMAWQTSGGNLATASGSVSLPTLSLTWVAPLHT